MNNQANYEVINVSRATFPKTPIVINAETDKTISLLPGDMVVWREIEGKVYLLRNAHWFRRLTLYFVKPEVENNGGI